MTWPNCLDSQFTLDMQDPTAPLYINPANSYYYAKSTNFVLRFSGYDYGPLVEVSPDDWRLGSHPVIFHAGAPKYWDYAYLLQTHQTHLSWANHGVNGFAGPMFDDVWPTQAPVVCDCNLNGAHEIWCDDWKPYGCT